MKSKPFIVIFFSLMFAGVVLWSCGKSGETENSDPQKTSAQASSEIAAQNIDAREKPIAPQANVDIVYYFMTTQRCSNCMKIEAYTREAVEKGFADALKKETMIWRMVNVEESANNHFIKDYQLYTKSVVLVKMRNGKQVEWKNLDQIWPLLLLNDKAGFQKYVTDEVRKFMGKSS